MRHHLCTLSYLPNDLPHNRYGFVVNRRIGQAVQRNRVRRLLRETLRLRDGRLRQGYDIVVIARPPIATVTFQTINQTLDDLLRRANLLAKL